MRTASGYSIVETLVGIGATSLALAVFAGVLVFAERSASQILLVSTRDEMQARMNRNLLDENAILVSRRADPILNSCFLTGAQTSSCPAQQEVGISFYDSSGSLVAGPPDSPALFRADGGACTAAMSRCPIRVSATVRAQGTPDPNTNQLPTSPSGMYEFIEIRYQITVDGSAVGSNVRNFVMGSTVIDTMDALGTP